MTGTTEDTGEVAREYKEYKLIVKNIQMGSSSFEWAIDAAAKDGYVPIPNSLHMFPDPYSTINALHAAILLERIRT